MYCIGVVYKEAVLSTQYSVHTWELGPQQGQRFAVKHAVLLCVHRQHAGMVHEGRQLQVVQAGTHNLQTIVQLL